MAVNDIFDQIETLIAEGAHVFLTNKVLINDNDLTRLLDDLKNELPKDIQNAQQIMEDKDNILNEARAEAQRITDQAKEYAATLVDNSAVVRQSQEKADLIMEQAKAQEAEILDRSMQESLSLKKNSNQYANQVFDHLVMNVASVLETLQKAKSELARMPIEPVRPSTPQPVAVSEYDEYTE